MGRKNSTICEKVTLLYRKFIIENQHTDIVTKVRLNNSINQCSNKR